MVKKGELVEEVGKKVNNQYIVLIWTFKEDFKVQVVNGVKCYKKDVSIYNRNLSFIFKRLVLQ